MRSIINNQVNRALTTAASTPAAAATPLRVRGLDHVCVVVSDVVRSISWYSNVLGLSHEFADDPSFGTSPAFLRSGGAAVALLPLAEGDKGKIITDHRGAHFALNVDLDEFHRFRAILPSLLEDNTIVTAGTRGGGGGGNVSIDAQDYGLQLSLFFSDPDNNIVEVTTWTDRSETNRL
jgi:catechol 2,3-dioxygenase-like lactoylglutathione lyase family enzyme